MTTPIALAPTLAPITRHVGDIVKLRLHPNGALFSPPTWTIPVDGPFTLQPDDDSLGATVTCVAEGTSTIAVSALVGDGADAVNASLGITVLASEPATDLGLAIDDGPSNPLARHLRRPAQ